MSRASYIWVVLDSRTSEPLGAFTVKYECADWMGRNDLPIVKVARFRDGYRFPVDPPTWLDPETLEPIKNQTEGRS